MKNKTNISRIQDCIAEAHQFTSNIESSNSISRDYLINKLSDISSTKIHIALLELKELKIIEYNHESGLIFLNK